MPGGGTTKGHTGIFFGGGVIKLDCGNSFTAVCIYYNPSNSTIIMDEFIGCQYLDRVKKK